MTLNIRRLKCGCYAANLSMSIVGNLPPLLFLTFRSLYGISYSMLGSLILINFTTQLLVDLIFSFFSHRFNIPKTVKFMPLLTIAGLSIFAAAPILFPHHVYWGLVIGTVLFSAASGLAEVLISPVIAALPAENPDREMSKLHSVYAWGAFAVVVISSGFLFLLGAEFWQLLVLIWLVAPAASFLFLFGQAFPKVDTPERASGALSLLKNKGIWLCVAAIFIGGAAECTMAQWSSTYLELALGIPKILGDIFGVALFAVMLGLGRSLYAKYGQRIEKILLLCGISSAVCYIVSALSFHPVIGLLACALTGFCTSMLWPGNLVAAASRFPAGGVFIYALMAAGGDLGASVVPQLVGIITDNAITNPYLLQLANQLQLQPEQLGIKLGLLLGAIFPLLSIPIFLKMIKQKQPNV